MRRRRLILLTVLLGIDVVFFGWCILERTSRPAPPRPPAEGIVDSETARDFQRLWVLAENPGPADMLALGQAYAVYGFFPEADQCLERAIALRPEAAANWFWSGLVLNRLGQTARSTERLLEAARLDPDRVDECRYIAARNHLRDDSLAKAEDEVRQIGPDHLAGQYLLAYLMVHTDRSAEAMPILDRLIARFAQVHRLYQLRARAEELLGDDEAARRDRETAERVPESIATDAVADHLGEKSYEFGLERRIVAAGRLNTPGNLDALANELTTILSISYRPRIARLLASIELRRGRSDAAVTLLKQLIRRDGATSDTLIELGLAMDAAEQDLTQVLLVFQQALQYQLDPEICRLMSPFVKDSAANVDRLEALQKHAEGLQAFRENRLDQAVTLFEAAAPVAHQRQAESNFFLGECLWHLDRREAALEAYRRCLELRPHHGRAADRIGYVDQIEQVDRKGEG